MKTVYFFLALLFTVTLSSGQVDFSGDWKLNDSKSTSVGDYSMSPKSIVINQAGNKMTVVKHSEIMGEKMTSESTYTLDGKECINTGFMETRMKSNAVWSDDKKSLEITTKFTMGDSGEEFKFVEVYSIVDGALSISASTSSSFGNMSETGIFDKQN